MAPKQKCTDDLCAYQTVKMVAIRDRRLGILKFTLLFVIAVYILIYKVRRIRPVRMCARDGALSLSVCVCVCVLRACVRRRLCAQALVCVSMTIN